MQRYSALNSSIGLKGELLVKLEIVEFNPPPAISNNGKPEPASSKWMRTAPFSYVPMAAPLCSVVCANARGAAAIAVTAAPVVSMVRLILSIIGALLHQCHGRVPAIQRLFGVKQARRGCPASQTSLRSLRKASCYGWA